MISEIEYEDGQIRRLCGCSGKEQWFNLEKVGFNVIAECENCGDRFVYAEIRGG